MNSSLTIHCWTAIGTGGSDWDSKDLICLPGVVVADNWISEEVNNASLLVSCEYNRGEYVIVEVKVVGKVEAGPPCRAGNIAV